MSTLTSLKVRRSKEEEELGQENTSYFLLKVISTCMCPMYQVEPDHV